MTEKQNACAEQLTQEQEQELLEEEKYFQDRFAQLPCPPLPEGLCAENLCSRICADEGDHQVTVELSAVEEQIRQENSRQAVSDTKTEADKPKKMGECIEFPTQKAMQKNKKISLAQRRRRWAVACTLVLAVGLSAAFWKLKAPLELSDRMMMKSAAPEAAQELQEVPETAPKPEDAPMVAAMLPEASEEEDAEIPVEEQPEAAEAAQPEQAEQAAPEAAEEEPVLKMAVPQSESEPDSPAQALRSQILQSLDSGSTATGNAQATQNTADSTEVPILKNGQPETATTEPSDEAATPDSGETVEEEETTEETVEAIAPESAPQDKISVLRDVMQSAKEGKKKKTFQLGKGKLRYDGATGMAVLLDETDAERSSLQLTPGAQLLASSKTMVEMIGDAQSGQVTVNLYRLDDLTEPEQVRSLTIQGELFDSYSSGENGYTICTSVWFTREQVEAGSFLPMVDREEISAEQVHIVSGYGENDRVNYLLNVTLTLDSITTRADLYLQ